MIVKLQRALFPADAPILAYDKHRRHTRQITATKELKRLFGGKAKIYAEATLKGETMEIGRLVEDQPW